MNNFLLASLVIVPLATTSAYAQEATYTNTANAYAGHGDATAAQQAERAGHASGLYTWSAYSRNVGPASTVSGVPQNAVTQAASGNPDVPGAPSAGRSWN